MKSLSIKRILFAADVGDQPGEVTVLRLTLVLQDGEYAIHLALLSHHFWLIWLPKNRIEQGMRA